MFAYNAQQIWKKMTELEPTKNVGHHMTHDGRFNKLLTFILSKDKYVIKLLTKKGR